jgi:hypothetical protein
LAAVFLGVAIWGPIGAIIGIPLVAAGASIFDAYTKSYDLVPEVVDMVDEEPGETDTPEPAGSSALEDEDAGG